MHIETLYTQRSRGCCLIIVNYEIAKEDRQTINLNLQQQFRNVKQEIHLGFLTNEISAYLWKLCRAKKGMRKARNQRNEISIT